MGHGSGQTWTVVNGDTSGKPWEAFPDKIMLDGLYGLWYVCPQITASKKQGHVCHQSAGQGVVSQQRGIP